jgi:AcrR family transcriptional regulator
VARTARPEAFAAKRGAILESARRLVLTKGYADMSIQDVLADLQISGGAFHHYFESRAALLEALIQRIEEESSRPLLPILHDPRLNAIQKLQGFLHALDRLRFERRGEVVAALRVWYTDANAVVRQRVDEAVREQRAPWLSEIVCQGIREGAFTTPFPDQAGQILMALLQAMGDAHARMLLSTTNEVDRPQLVERILATHAAFTEAIERVLGAPRNTFQRADAEAVLPWITALEKA